MCNYSPHEWEDLIEEQLRATLDPAVWRLERQHRGAFKDRIDLHIAERRQGGHSIVVDMKHFRNTELPAREVDDVVGYKRRKRASLAVLVVSPRTQIARSAWLRANKHGAEIVHESPREAAVKVANLCAGVRGRKSMSKVVEGTKLERVARGVDTAATIVTGLITIVEGVALLWRHSRDLRGRSRATLADLSLTEAQASTQARSEDGPGMSVPGSNRDNKT